mmetsp:Transcript_4933/g.17641  ORF Transcript_4933/g.17641 Transcript_4933/m.17641 type:complete len:224 (+) Transcript_4933:863-1534(+)
MFVSVGPASRKRHSRASMRPFCCMIAIVRSSENMSLCDSKSDRHTLLYSEYVKYSFRISILCWTSSFSSASSMPRINREMNHAREYWYIGSTSARSEMQKNKTDARVATGRYSSRVASMSFSVLSASATFSVISFDVTFDCDSVSMRTSSSRMFPVELDRRYKILSSISLSSFFIRALDTTSSFFSSARSFRSCSTTTPRSWSSRPSSVTKKFSSDTLTDTSG